MDRRIRSSSLTTAVSADWTGPSSVSCRRNAASRRCCCSELRSDRGMPGQLAQARTGPGCLPHSVSEIASRSRPIRYGFLAELQRERQSVTIFHFQRLWQHKPCCPILVEPTVRGSIDRPAAVRAAVNRLCDSVIRLRMFCAGTAEPQFASVTGSKPELWTIQSFRCPPDRAPCSEDCRA